MNDCQSGSQLALAPAWGELSDDLPTWTIPGERTKNGAVHVVPLSEAARDLLRGLLPGDISKLKRVASDALVLPGAASTPFSGWSKAKAALDRAVADARGGDLASWSVHDLRRTVATGLQRLGVRLEATEAVLNHISGSRAGIAGVYQRHDWAGEKRAVLDAWAAHVLALAEGRSPTDNVVKLGRAG